jgi:hypothetical protein
MTLAIGCQRKCVLMNTPVASCDLTFPTDVLATNRRDAFLISPKLNSAGNTVSAFQKPFALRQHSRSFDMKASKTLTSLVAAAAVAGSIGLAYAQTTDMTTPPATPSAPATMENQGTTTTTPSTPSTTEPAGMQAERPAQADRN